MKRKEKDEVLIPQWSFDDRKEYLISLTLAPAKDKFVKSFINQFNMYGTPENVIYRGICSLAPAKEKFVKSL